MFKRLPSMLLVCLVILFATITAVDAWDVRPAAFADRHEDLAAPSFSQSKLVSKIKPQKPIVKCKPLPMPQPVMGQGFMQYSLGECILPISRPGGWQFDAEVLFARVKGKLRYFKGVNFGWTGMQDEIDMVSDMGLPNHQVVPTLTAKYRFQPQWAARYSFSGMQLEGSPTSPRNFVFGTNQVGFGQQTRTKWEHYYHRVGLVYDPILTPSSRIGIFGEYARVDDKISSVVLNCCGDTMEMNLNMAMAGIEIERCVRNVRALDALSLECKAGVGFGDDSLAADLSTSLKYSVPMNNGKWGYIAGGYRYTSYKKKESDLKSIDVAMDGGFFQLGFIF